MFKKKLKKYDDPRDTHGFYEQFNDPIEVSEVMDALLWVAASICAATILWCAFA